MQPLRLTLLFATLNFVGSAGEPLRVLRASPETPADPFAAVTITFDRPVAGGLDTTVDPAAIFRIAPAVEGRLEWRDPITLRFTPAAPLRPGGEYVVTVAAAFTAMDGSSLERAYEHRFTVAGPLVLGGSPANGHEQPQHLPSLPTFAVLLSAPASGAELARDARILLDRACGSRTVELRATGERRVSPQDPPSLRYTGLRVRQAGDTLDLRRIVDLEPVAPLPPGCGGELALPAAPGSAGSALLRWPFRTYGPLRVVEAAACAPRASCPTGPVRITFSSPVRGADVQRRVRVLPSRPFTVRDTAAVSATWILDATLQPRTQYAILVDTGFTDVFGQTLTGARGRAFRTTGYAPTIAYDYGRLLVERDGFRTLAVQHVNVDSLQVTLLPVPAAREADFLSRSWNWEEPLASLASSAIRRRIAVAGRVDERRVTGVGLPVSGEPAGTPAATLYAVQVNSASLDSAARRSRPVALVQVTDLAVHARIGIDQGEVWVTGVTDGLPRGGAAVTLFDARGRARASAVTDGSGIARLAGYRTYSDSAQSCADGGCNGFEGYVAASLGADRAVVGLNEWDPDLAPWRFGIWGAWGEARAPVAGALFTERGIYRPGEVVRAKAILRRGALGDLRAPPGDSARWLFRDRDDGILRDTTVALSDFGTSDESVSLGPDAPLGYYAIQLEARIDGAWRAVAWGNYQVAEYRPPEFLVDVQAEETARFGGDTARAHIAGRYLFGAPMAHAPVRWVLRVQPRDWGVGVPGAEDFQVGGGGYWGDEESGVEIAGEGADSLDATGALELRLPLPTPAGGRPATATVQALVTDANRQTVAAAASFTVHPASFYIGARTTGDAWFWTAGQPVRIEVIAVRPDGERVSDASVRGVVVRREWHRVRRVRAGQIEEVGGWVADTVATCAVRTRSEPATCTFTPPSGGSYTVTFSAADAEGRPITTSLSRWASGTDWVPWNDESQLRIDVIADRPRYTVGDTASLLIASPFTDAEAWVTVERERILDSRRIRIAAGATTLRVPITEALAPNAFVSVLIVRGRSAPPGPLDDAGRPTLRVGYAELRVTPEVKRLAVSVAPLAVVDGPSRSTGGRGDGVSRSSAGRADGTSRSSVPRQDGAALAGPVEYRPGDSAWIRLRVRDAGGTPQRAEVTVWAVDEGVLALTGYRTPDPVDLLYAARGVGVRLASNLVAVAPQIPEGPKGRREAGGGGGGDLAGVLRSRFQTTAFFLGSVVTDEAGEAIARAKLPDNVTTFRVMAVAVTAGDRYGSGESSFLVTRPLIARPALPRFVRPGDRFAAGAVVNHRLGGSPRVEVETSAERVSIEGGKKQRQTLGSGRPAEFRFEFRMPGGRDGRGPPWTVDSALFRFVAKSEREADGVEVRVPVRRDYQASSSTIAGVLRDTASLEFQLEGDVDAMRSRLTLSFGLTPLAVVVGARQDLRVYPYYCTEQLASVALPLVALYRAERELGGAWLVGDADAEIRRAIALLARRQNPDGGFGYWSAESWGTPTLSAHVGRVLLEARAAGVAVDSAVLERLAENLGRSLDGAWEPRVAVAWWYTDEGTRLSERLAAAEFLSRFGRPSIATENALLSNAARLRWEDRLLLAELFARRGQTSPARDLVERALAGVRMAGRRVDLPREAYAEHYFRSSSRPAARLLSALVELDASHPMIPPVLETLVQQGNVRGGRIWNTQDYAHAVLALMRVQAVAPAAGQGSVRMRSGSRTVLASTFDPRAPRDTSFTLERLVQRGADGRPMVRLSLQAPPGQAPAFFHATVREVPRARQVTPVDRGIAIERWYETVDTRRPTVSVLEGELVRVRVRLTLGAERHFVVIDDPLPAGLEPVDLSLRTVSPFGYGEALAEEPRDMAEEARGSWYYGSWDSGLWSPFDHKELRDDRVVYSAAILWPGTYTATYLARATTAGTFVVPPAHAEEMYNPGVNGRTGGLDFTVLRAVR